MKVKVINLITCILDVSYYINICLLQSFMMHGSILNFLTFIRVYMCTYIYNLIANNLRKKI